MLLLLLLLPLLLLLMLQLLTGPTLAQTSTQPRLTHRTPARPTSRIIQSTLLSVASRHSVAMLAQSRGRKVLECSSHSHARTLFNFVHVQPG
jgi:hypothetical protein